MANTKKKEMREKHTTAQNVAFVFLCMLVVLFIYPIIFIIINSFKGKFFISKDPFSLPSSETFVGISNYVTGLTKSGFLDAIFWSFFITIISVGLIVLFTSMTAYYITRVKSKLTEGLYFLFAFSMVVPFQMVMFTMTSLADKAKLNNPLGMCFLYLGFGAGLAIFMFCGFVKSLPLEIEEASFIDGCNPLQNYFQVVFPILKPTTITVAILQAMYVWNDYLLPYLVIGLSTKYKTIPVVVQMLVGSNGNKDMGAMMAMLVLAIIPIVIFYLACQKYIIEGVVAGAVKG